MSNRIGKGTQEAQKAQEKAIAASFLCLLCLLCSFPAYGAGEYRTVEIESLKITIDTEWAMQTAPGYVPVRFDITNLGDERTIEIVGQGTRWFRSSGGTAMDVRQNLHLKRGDRMRFTMPEPAFGDNENIQFQVREGGRMLEAFNYSGFQSGKSLEDAPVLIVADPSSGFGALATGWPRPTPPMRGYYAPPGRASPRLDFVLDPSRVPANWLGFTSLRAVVIGPKEWEQLSEVQKNALLTFAACGGDLIFVDGDLKTLIPAAKGDSSGEPQRYFFGVVHLPKLAEVAEKGFEGTLAEVRAAVKNSAWSLPANRAPDWGLIAERGFRLPIPGVEGVPIRAYMLILILFTALIWPVNYIFLFRHGQQVLLVLTVPLISALFIAVLAAYAFTGEGFGVRGRAVTFTVLDQATKQAATRASISLYAAGMTPSGGLHFSRDMAVFAIGNDGQGSRDRQSLDLTEFQQFSSGIVQARSPSNFDEIGFRPARERLSFSSDGGRVSVINGLGVTVGQILYLAGGNMYTLGAPLQAGEKAILQPALRKEGETYFADLLKSAPLSAKKLQDVVKDQADGSYLAVLERSPFWESGVSSLDERGSIHLVLGYVGGEP